MPAVMRPNQVSWPPFELACVSRPCPGEVECGDAIWIETRERELRMAVVDGLGHGPAAAQAAEHATLAIAQASWEDLGAVMRHCDAALRGTRGAAVTLLRIGRDGKAEHCGIGNIALAFFGQRASGSYARPGIVGARPRKISVDQFEVSRGALIVVHSDGLSQRLTIEEHQHDAVELIAQRLLERWGRGHDDASCLVIRRKMVD